MRAETESAKSQQRLGALQDLRNQVNAINMQNQQFAQQLALQKAAAGQTLTDYEQQMARGIQTGETAGSQFNTVAGQNTGTNLAVSPTSRTATAPIQQTGSVTSRRPEDYIGVAQPTTNPDERLYNSLYGGL